MRRHHPGTYEDLQARLVQAELERDSLVEQLEAALRERDAIGAALGEPCAECGHIDWRSDGYHDALVAPYQREADIQLGEKLAAQMTLKAVCDALDLPMVSLGNGWTEATPKILARIEEIVNEGERGFRERDQIRSAWNAHMARCGLPAVEGMTDEEFFQRIHEWQNAPSGTASALATTYQWLIERGQPEGLPSAVWLENSAKHPATHREWTTNAREAAMFPDRETAERYIANEELEARAVEHGFMESNPAKRSD